MAPVVDSILRQVTLGLKPMDEEYCRLAEDAASELPYDGGVSLTSSDVANLRIAFDRNAKIGFWKPADPNTRRALEGALEGALDEPWSNDLETLLDGNTVYKKEFIECPHPTIEDAYSPSDEYNRILQYVVNIALFHNEALVDSSGDDLFHDLCLGYLWSRVHIETRRVFCSPGYPHITILSIQPQRAPSPKQLLRTEFWTLYYWAQKIARRALHTTTQYLPMRLVSLCGFEARMVSAVFSLGYPRSTVMDVGGKKDVDVKCQIHIDEYRDLSDLQSFRDLMEELVAKPCGNVDVPRKARRKDRV